MAYVTTSDLTGLGYDLFATLGTITSPTVTASGSGGTITPGTYSVVIAALNLTAAGKRFLNYQEANIKVDPDDGVTLPSSPASVIVGTGNNIDITISPLIGAAAYAIFVGAITGEETLQIISTGIEVTLSQLVTGGTPASEITEDTSGDTTALNNICQWASDLADGYCAQPLGLVEDDMEDCQVKVKDGILKVFPRSLPLTEIFSLTIYSNDLNQSLTLTDFKLFSKLGFGMAKATFCDGNYYGELTYSHGYSIIPSEVKTAIILTVQTILDDYYFAKLTEIAGAKYIKQGQLTIQRDDTMKLPANAANILNKYRRVR
jgi:hypothetical protein